MSLYHVTAQNTKGINGDVILSNGKLVKTSHPLEVNEGFNPEELIALAWSTCLNATVKSLLSARHLGHLHSRVEVKVSLEKEPKLQGYYFQVDGLVSIKDLSQEEGESVLTEAHQRCPVSKLMTGSVSLTLKYLEWE
ncbi:MAG: OsmC family protein [Streptococcus sp.]|nr:OsmC family protein [Streptococcus sp.]